MSPTFNEALNEVVCISKNLMLACKFGLLPLFQGEIMNRCMYCLCEVTHFCAMTFG